MSAATGAAGVCFLANSAKRPPFELSVGYGAGEESLQSKKLWVVAVRASGVARVGSPRSVVFSTPAFRVLFVLGGNVVGIVFCLAGTIVTYIKSIYSCLCHLHLSSVGVNVVSVRACR